MAERRSFGRRASNLLIGLPLLLAVAACTSQTPYQPADRGFGYSQQQIEDNRYRVSFSGNSVTPRDTVQNYLLYRAAEVTLESGNDYFVVVNDNLERSTRYYGTVDPMFASSRFYGHRDPFYDPFFSARVSARPIDEYTAFADIQVFEGEKPERDPRAYDARDVLRRLEPTVVREAS